MQLRTTEIFATKDIRLVSWYKKLSGGIDTAPGVYDTEEDYIQATNLYYTRIVCFIVLAAIVLFFPVDLSYLPKHADKFWKLTYWRLIFIVLMSLSWIWCRLLLKQKDFAVWKWTFVCVCLSTIGCMTGSQVGPFSEPWMAVFLMVPFGSVFIIMDLKTRAFSNALVMFSGIGALAISAPSYVTDPFFPTYQAYIFLSILGGTISGALFDRAARENYHQSAALKEQQETLRVKVEERTQEVTRAFQELEDSQNQVRRAVAHGLQDQLGHLIALHNISLHQFISEHKSEPTLQEKGELFLEQLLKIEEGARRIVEDSKANISGQTGLLQIVESCLIPHKERQKFELEWIVEPEDIQARADIAFTLSRVLQEAITNTIKHAEATKVEVCVLQSEDGLSMSIRDNGKGFDPTLPTSRLGLKGIKERIQKIGAEFEIYAKEGEGAELIVTVRDEKQATDSEAYYSRESTYT